jgi:transcriptional regulator with XRE-family HTH domain
MGDNIRIRIGSRIKELRTEKGLSLRQLAELSGVQYPNLSAIENGKYNARLDTLEKLESIFGKELDFGNKDKDMKIVKSTKGFRQVFDTGNTSSIGEYAGSTTGLDPLHHTSYMTDYEYLKQFFPENHSIFLDFDDSFYYVL